MILMKERHKHIARSLKAPTQRDVGEGVGASVGTGVGLQVGIVEKHEKHSCSVSHPVTSRTICREYRIHRHGRPSEASHCLATSFCWGYDIPE